MCIKLVQYNWGAKLMKLSLGVNRNINTSGNMNGFEPLRKKLRLGTHHDFNREYQTTRGVINT